MSARLLIETLAPDDAADLLPLLDQVQALHVDAHPEIFHADSPPQERADFLGKWIATDQVTALVARGTQQRILGYAIFEVSERPAGVLKRARKQAVLHHVTVSAEHRGGGIGKCLINEVKIRARTAGADAIVADYFCFNQASAALMRSAGMAPLRVTTTARL